MRGEEGGRREIEGERNVTGGCRDDQTASCWLAGPDQVSPHGPSYATLYAETAVVGTPNQDGVRGQRVTLMRSAAVPRIGPVGGGGGIGGAS